MNSEQEQGFTYTSQGGDQRAFQHEAPAAPDAQPQEMIQWKASEFVDHEKNNSWFLLLGIGSVVVSGLTYLISKSIFSSFVVLVAGVAFGVTAKQKPRTLTYALMASSIKVGDKSYSYDDFRTFSLIRDGALWSIVLQPVKRLMPTLTIYFAQEDGEKIFDMLASRVPHEERELDAIDKFLRRIRF